MSTSAQQKRIRVDLSTFGGRRVMEVPFMHSMQLDSYASFLQLRTPPMQRADEGLQHAFTSIFPIASNSGRFRLEFVSYSIENPELSLAECRARGKTYEIGIWASVRLIALDDNGDLPAEVREHKVFVTTIPLMTGTGSFLINGTERVVIAQMHRSPGAFFTRNVEKTTTGEHVTVAARISPARGTWIEFEYDSRGNMFFRLDKKRKLPVTTLLRALGLDTEQILATFFDHDEFRVTDQSLRLRSRVRVGDVFPVALVDAKEREIRAGDEIKAHRMPVVPQKGIRLPHEYLLGRILAKTIEAEDGSVIGAANDEVTEALLKRIIKNRITRVTTIRINDKHHGAWISSTLRVDRTYTQTQARAAIHAVVRPNDSADEEAIDIYMDSVFSSEALYEMSDVGRHKFNARVYRKPFQSDMTPEWYGKLVPHIPPEESLTSNALHTGDILAVLASMLELSNGRGASDDVDSLDTRRVRPVGELLADQIRLGLSRAAYQVRERLSRPDTSMASLGADQVFNTRSVSSTIREFFTSSQLSQFMDQTNPLSEVTHKRRVSALGPGGLTKDTTSFEVRDVHTSHYGRLCPIETPEGPNIGLINSLALYARTNKLGFIETPFRAVYAGTVSDDIVYLTADKEQGFYIAQASADMDVENNLIGKIQCRLNGEPVFVDPLKVNFIDVALEQAVSVAASSIPFLEHDDANRSLMGANMLRQAVPCLFPEKPLVGTGAEWAIARDSGNLIAAVNAGTVAYSDAKRIIVKRNVEGSDQKADVYELTKRMRSNQNTDITQRPIVKRGDAVKVGDVLADGSASDLGELALGQNMVVAFTPWHGYNYEDSILISERVIADDRFTSIHIEELTIQARETKLGAETVTRDVPSLSEAQLSLLDKSGVVYIGAHVKPGDVIVGKVTPKGESSLGPEDKLLRAIFGESATDVSETCLRVPAGMVGIVIGVQIFTKSNEPLDERAQAIVKDRVEESRVTFARLRRTQERNVVDKTRKFLVGKTMIDGANKVILSDKDVGLIPSLERFEIRLSGKEHRAELLKLKQEFAKVKVDVGRLFAKKEKALRGGDDLPAGVIKSIRVQIGVKRKLQAGDKMAGRHGNKGVVSRVVAVEDMPHLKDGTPVDVVLNPLGVPSRMNVGQVLEVHLGWAALGIGQRISEILETGNPAPALRQLFSDIADASGNANQTTRLGNDALIEMAHRLKKGLPFASPVFDGASEEKIRALLKIAYPDEVAEKKGLIPSRMQARLIHGQTGEEFERPVTVGVMNMLKLYHLVEDKMHARSTGPYSLVTQQPLGGKSQFGGQRVGEMEVWALEAYGAAHILQEMLTVKSDDVRGREATYENLIQGNHDHTAGMPESFSVLVRELRSLGLDITLERDTQEQRHAKRDKELTARALQTRIAQDVRRTNAETRLKREAELQQEHEQGLDQE